MSTTTPSVSQSVSAVTLTVSSGSPSTSVSQTFSDSATLASLQIGSNSIPITNPAILSRFATPGLQCSNTLSIEYGGLTNVSTPAAVNNFVATPLILSNFGPFTYSYVSGGVGTFTLPQPSSNGSSPGAFTYSVVGSTGVVSVSSNVVTMIAAGSTTIRVTQAAAGGYASVYIDASVTINPPPPLVLDANGVTIKYTPSSIPSVPYFIQASLRGTLEWFAVVNDTSKSAITDYAKAPLSGYGRLYFTTSGNVVPFNNIVTTLMTDMSYMFRDTPWFNENIGSWDISNVTSMSNMFYRAERFNQNIGSWNTSNVVDMSYALVLASAFNQPINSWNTSKVTNMSYMLGGMTVFNQPINSWDTANVIYMGAMFQNSSNFNQNIGSWNTSNVTNMSNMFDGATKFNQPINYDSTTGSWNTTNVTNMNSMFQGATVFNQNISSWNVVKVTQKPPSNFSTGSALTTAYSPIW